MKATHAIISILLGILLVAILHSCKKSSDIPGLKNRPLPMEHGIIDGPIVTKLIGAEGGTFFSGDNMVRIDIPPGTVSSPTSFSIQPVTKTLAAGAGKAYRIGPAGVNFQKDITLKFRYTEAELEGTNEDQLYLAYQDAQGYWHHVVKTNIDKSGKYLTAKTKHFSDWVIERVFYIRAEKQELKAGEEVRLTTVYCDAAEDDLLAPLEIVPDKHVETWFLHGTGTLPEMKTGANTYKAPATISAPQTVTVGARIKNMVNARNPERPGNGGVVLVQRDLNLVPDEYFTWEFNGATHTAQSMDAVFLNNATILIGTALTGGVNISLNASKPGQYDLGDQTLPDYFSIQVFQSAQNDVMYEGAYRACNSPVVHYGKGKINITQYGTVGGIIAGDFSATVYWKEDCENLSKQVTGQFRVRRQL
ncbi:MAG TPA: DUF6252 family protein [Flavihumibacter sp.]|jgi:hypothetical protein